MGGPREQTRNTRVSYLGSSAKQHGIFPRCCPRARSQHAKHMGLFRATKRRCLIRVDNALGPRCDAIESGKTSWSQLHANLESNRVGPAVSVPCQKRSVGSAQLLCCPHCGTWSKCNAVLA